MTVVPYYFGSWKGFKWYFFHYKLHRYRHWKLYWLLTRKQGECWCCGDVTTVGRQGDSALFECHGCAFEHPSALDSCKTVRAYSSYLNGLYNQGYRPDEFGILQPPEIVSRADFKPEKELTPEEMKGVHTSYQFLGPKKKDEEKVIS